MTACIICMLCFVLINGICLNLLCVWSFLEFLNPKQGILTAMPEIAATYCQSSMVPSPISVCGGQWRGGGGGVNVYLSYGDGDCLLILPRQPGKMLLLFFEFQLHRGSFTCARRFISAEKIQSVYP